VLKALAPRIIDLLLASNEASHIALDDRSCADGLREFARLQYAGGDRTTPRRRRLCSDKSIARSDGRGVDIDGKAGSKFRNSISRSQCHYAEGSEVRRGLIRKGKVGLMGPIFLSDEVAITALIEM
jgi:hypothetical protein